MASELNSFPPSPTLTNPDLILPSAMSARSMAAKTTPTRPTRAPPPAPTEVSMADGTIKNTTSTVEAAGMPLKLSTQLSPGQQNRSSPDANLESDEMDVTPKRSHYPVQSFQALRQAASNPNVALASSPTIGDALGSPAWALKTTSASKLNGITNGTRRMSSTSNTSSSVHSEDLEKWKPHSANLDADGSIADDDMERKLKQFRSKFGQKKRLEDDETETEAESDQEAWPTQRDGETSEDFLSRRAEVILANAKKKLNRMEGNLKGARHSLSSSNMSSRYTNSFVPARYRMMNSGLRSVNSTPGHSRAASEASLPSPVPAIPIIVPGAGIISTRQTTLSKRSSSAMGSYALVGGPSSLDRTFPTSQLRAAHSQEAMRESRLKSWIMDDRSHYHPPGHHLSSPLFDTQKSSSAPHSHHGYSSVLNSPTNSEFSKRPASQASEIRAQMNELREKISEIKERAKESSKRSSLISAAGLRTPSPSRSSPGNNSSPLGSVKRGQKGSNRNSLETKTHSSSPSSRPKSAGSGLNPTRGKPPQFILQDAPENAVAANKRLAATLEADKPGSRSFMHRQASPGDELTEYEESHYEDAEETLDDLEDSLDRPSQAARNAIPVYTPGAASLHEHIVTEVIEEIPELEVSDVEDANLAHSPSSSAPIYRHDDLQEYLNGEDFERDMESSVSGATEYFEASQDMGNVVSHEDRADAFDYENFFLHSAMGTYSREVRRGDRPYSSGSDSNSTDTGSSGSVETTRPASAYRDNGDAEEGSEEYQDGSDVEEEYEDEKRKSLQELREMNISSASVATFQTAQEGKEFDDFDDFEDDENELDEAIAQHLPSTRSSAILVNGARKSVIINRTSIPPPPAQLPADPPPPTSSGSSSSNSSNPNRQSISVKDLDTQKKSALLSNFIGYDSISATPETIHVDRMLVEGAVLALQKACLELQRAAEGSQKREALRDVLEEVRKVLRNEGGAKGG